MCTPQIIWLSCVYKKSQINQMYKNRNKIGNWKIPNKKIIKINNNIQTQNIAKSKILTKLQF